MKKKDAPPDSCYFVFKKVKPDKELFDDKITSIVIS